MQAESSVRLNDDLLRFVLVPRAPRRFWLTVVVLGGVLMAGAIAVGLLVVVGLQLLGLSNTVYWAILIANFVFFVGVSHAGVMISAILRLARAEWRRPRRSRL
jgi:Ni/Fe-hydrogenase subunit HybB-like protein